MTMIAGRTERARIEAEIAKARAEQKRLPSHWADRREILAERIDGLVHEWLDADE
ncbi:MAG: hypothetical protein ACXVIQ_14630 [Ilumatobacteraceae bacterium]